MRQHCKEFTSVDYLHLILMEFFVEKALMQKFYTKKLVQKPFKSVYI